MAITAETGPAPYKTAAAALTDLNKMLATSSVTGSWKLYLTAQDQSWVTFGKTPKWSTPTYTGKAFLICETSETVPGYPYCLSAAGTDIKDCCNKLIARLSL